MKMCVTVGGFVVLSVLFLKSNELLFRIYTLVILVEDMEK